MSSARLLLVVSRVLRFFPALILAFVIVSCGLGVRDLFFHAADQLVQVQSAIGGR